MDEKKLSEDFKFVQRVIKRLIKGTPKSYPGEVLMIKKLLNQFNDKKFWLYYTPKKEIPSFSHLLSPWGKEDLRNQFNLFRAENKPVEAAPKMEEEKVGEDLVITKKKKTISELLAD